MIGFGSIAENRLAKEGFALDRNRFAPLAEAELEGVTDINPVRREAAAALGVKWYADAAALLMDPQIEAVFVTTNNQSHASLTIQAMEAGKHVIVEKPIATRLEDARQMCVMARERRLSLAVDHMMIYNAYNIKAKEQLALNVVGPVNDCCFHMECCYGRGAVEAASWRCSKPEEMGGPLGDVASHCFYMAEYIFGKAIVELACVYYPKLMNIVVEDGAYLKFKLSDGLCGSIRVAFSEPRGGMDVTLDNLGYEIYGEEGVIRGHGTMFQLSGFPDEPIPVRLEVDRIKDRYDVVIEHPVNIYQQVVRSHAQSILKNRPFDGEEGYHNLKLIAAAHESARNCGKLIKIDI